VFRKHNDPKILLNVNLLTSRSFWSRIHAPRSHGAPSGTSATDRHAH
jgi:hypothetical protein